LLQALKTGPGFGVWLRRFLAGAGKKQATTEAKPGKNGESHVAMRV
jgi:hypothetical protein